MNSRRHYIAESDAASHIEQSGQRIGPKLKQHQLESQLGLDRQQDTMDLSDLHENQQLGSGSTRLWGGGGAEVDRLQSRQEHLS